MEPLHCLFTVAFSVAVPLASAQEPQSPRALPTVDPGAAEPLPEGLVIPIHTLPADPQFGEYGVWAGGVGYKVRFANDVTFFPRLGRSAPRNLPLTWRTLAVRIGDRVLADAAAGAEERVASPVRYEYRRGSVLEAYDVRPDGIEQTFVLADRPDPPGDLVVEGCFATELRTPAVPADRHAEIGFVDQATGRTVVRYGPAFVVDASGRKAPIRTTCDGSRVRLCVPDAFLREAEFPVTIDPLTTPVIVDINSYLHADLGTQNESTNQTQVLAVSLYTSATDIDLVVYSYGPDWLTQFQLFADVSDGWHANHPAVAYCAGADRWIVAFERQNTASQIRLYLHARDDTGFNTGQFVFMSRMASDYHDWKADVGCQANGNLALVVCQSEIGTTFNPDAVSTVFGRLVNMSNGQMASLPLPLAGSTSIGFERENPTVVAVNGGAGTVNNYWQTAWSQRNVFAGKFQIQTTQVNSDGTVPAALRIDDPAQDFQKVLPKIDGGGFGDRDLLVTYTLADNLGQAYGRFIHGTRFRNTSLQITDVRHRSIVAANSGETVVNNGLAFDWGTRSHWGLGFHSAGSTGTPRIASVTRVGYQAVVTEQQALTTLGQAGALPLLAYSASPHGFAVVNAQFGAAMGRHFVYRADAGSTVIGPGCGTSTIDNTHPYPGNAHFSINVRSLPFGQTALPLLALGRGAVPLDFLGMLGCVLHLDPTSLLSLPAQTIVFGTISINLPLPEAFAGDLYTQCAYTDPAAPGGARVSPGLQVRVR